MGSRSRSRLNKVVSVFFSFILVFSLIPSAAFAAEPQQGGESQGQAQQLDADGGTSDEGTSTDADSALQDEGADADADVDSDVGTYAVDDGPQVDDGPFSGGTGTEDDPYLISSADDMVELASSVNDLHNSHSGDYFKMTCDIDLSPVCYEVDGSPTNDVSWTPIGGTYYNSSRFGFAGNFDGDGHSILNLYINGMGNSNGCGLFGLVMNSVIENLTITGYVGNGGKSQSFTGGVVGWLWGSNLATARMTNVVSYVDVAGYQNVGGLVGKASDAVTIENCANHGRVSTDSYAAAGIVGLLQRNYVDSNTDCIIRNCYNDGAIYYEGTYSSVSLGGIVGIAKMSASNKSLQRIYSCYNAGSFGHGEYAATWIGGIYGSQSYGFNEAYDNYYLDDSMAKVDQSAVKAQTMTAEQMKSPAFAAQMGSAFAHVDGKYPALACEKVSGAPTVTSQPVGGDYIAGTVPPALAVSAELPSEGTGAGGTLSYQWYASATGSYYDAEALEGETASRLELPAGETGQTWYFCEASNSHDGRVDRSCSDIVRVYFAEAVAEVPVVSGPSEGVAVDYAAEAEPLQATVSNMDELGDVSYQWYVSANADGSGATAVSGATSASFEIDTKTPTSSYYFCRVTNTFQETSVASASTVPVKVEVRDSVTVSTAAQLAKVSENVAGGETYKGITVVLANDIDLSEVCGGDLGDWTPIGNKTVPFLGSFDGGYHRISNLSITDATAAYQALFGYVGQNGALASQRIGDFTVSGTVSAPSSSYVAGAVGYFYGNTSNSTDFRIENVRNEVEVTGSYYVGGVAGNLNYASAYKCTNAGSVTGISGTGVAGYYVAGIVGRTDWEVDVADCYNLGAVSGKYCVGGVAGMVHTEYSTYAKEHLARCYNAGTVSGESQTAAVCGSYATGYLPATDCFYLEGSGAEDVNAEAVTAAWLASPAAAAALGDAYAAGSAGHPELAWETASKGAPVITAHPEGGSANLGDVSPSKMEVSAYVWEGFPFSAGMLSYQWWSSSDDAMGNSDDAMVEGAVEAAFAPSTASASALRYYCVVTNTWDGGSASSTSAMAGYPVHSGTAAAVPVFSVHPQGASYGALDAPAELTAQASVSGDGAGELSYQWYSNTIDSKLGATPVEGATGETLAPSSVAGDRWYWCEATNTFELDKTATATSEMAKISVGSDAVVSDAASLRKLSELAAAGGTFEGITVALAADVDLGGEEAGAWTPIAGFHGTFEGGGHRVSGFYSTTGGLFDDVHGPAVVRGFVLQGEIDSKNIYDDNTGDSRYEEVGSIASTISDGVLIEDVGSEVDINACQAAGIAYRSSGTGNVIRRCYNSGTVTCNDQYLDTSDGTVYDGAMGTAFAAGILYQGQSRTAMASIENCYNTGDIAAAESNTATQYLFGISRNYANATNCYNTGSVGTSTNSGPIKFASSGLQGTIVNSYYLDTTATSAARSKGTPKTDEELRSAEMPGLLGSAFAADPEGGYPVLSWQLEKGAPTITSQPASAVVVLPAAAEPLRVEAALPAATAVGGGGTLSYKWQSSADGAEWTDIESANGAEYAPPAGEAGTTMYRCIVTNTYGDVTAATVSDTATVAVLATAPAVPEFSTQPQDAVGSYAGEQPVLAAEAGFAEGETAPTGTILYQWYISEDGTAEGGTPVEGATESSYSFPVDQIGTWKLYVVATSSIDGIAASSAASSVATVRVDPTLAISTPEEFLAFMQSTSSSGTGYVDYTDKLVGLTADIDLTACEATADWQPIASGKFAGTFDGQGHTVKLASTNGGLWRSLLSSSTKGIIRNFTLDVDIDAAGSVAGIAVSCDYNALKEMSGVTVWGSIDSAGGQRVVYVSGFFGKSYLPSTFARCANEADISLVRDESDNRDSWAYVGGFEGYTDGGGSYTQCVNAGDVYVEGHWQNAYAGGFCGYSQGRTFVDCRNEGDVERSTTTSSTGSVAGFYPYSNNTFTNCLNTGKTTYNGEPGGYPFGPGQQSSSKNNYYLDLGVDSPLASTTKVTAEELASPDMAGRLGDAWKSVGGQVLLSWEDGGGRPVVKNLGDVADYLRGSKAAEVSVEASLPAEGMLGHDGSLSYQWYFSESPKGRTSSDVMIDGATEASVVPDTNVASGYRYYYCAVTNTFGDGSMATTFSSPVTIHVYTDVPAAEPYFVVQPATTCYAKGDKAAAAEMPLQVEVAADGYPEGEGIGTVTYQWYAAKTIESYQQATGTPIKGATSASYVPYVEKTGTVYYYCVATNTFEDGTQPGKVATAKSAVVKARTWSEADAAPVVEQQPSAGQTYVQGDVAEAISVTASKPAGIADMLGGAADSGSSLHYQWYLMAGETSDPSSDSKVGEDSPSYVPPTDVDPDYYSYYCVVENTISIPNPRGTATSSVTTEPVRICVTSATEAAMPEVVSSVADGEAVQGGSVPVQSVEVANAGATGMGTVSYQWYMSSDDVLDPASDDAISGATEASLDMSTRVPRGTYRVYCEVTNTFENVKVVRTLSDAATITVKPHEVSNAQELASLAEKVNAGDTYEGCEVVLTADIDLSSVCGEDLGSWDPIGNNSSNSNSFNGTFDGQGHSIDNLWIDGAFTSYQGLFGYVNGGALKNFTVSGYLSYPMSYGYAGGAVGRISPTVGTIALENVGSYVNVFAGTPSSKYSFSVGGLAGDVITFDTNANGVVDGCFSRGSVVVSGTGSSGQGGAGGLIGCAQGKIIVSNSYNAGDVTGPRPGGVLGYGRKNNNFSPTMRNVFNWGEVTDPQQANALPAALAGNYSSIDAFENCHYLDTSCDRGEANSPESAGISKDTASTMTSASFVNTMGSSFKEGDEHPVLAWEPDMGYPSISVQPQGGQHVVKGDEAPTLYVVASLPAGDKAAAQGTLHYQWYKSTTGAVDTSVDAKVGSDSDEFVPSADEMGTAWYYCVVTDSYQGGSSSTTSSMADFTVTSGIPAAVPTITSQPTGASYAQNQDAVEMAVSAEVSGTGAGDLSYQWYRGRRADGADAEPVAGATSASYVPDTSQVGTFYLFCRATNTFETYSSASADSDIVELRIFGAEIASAADLAAIGDMVAEGNSLDGVGFELVSDIDLSEVCGPELGSWSPIGSSATIFKGSIEGNGHTISGLCIVDDSTSSSASSYKGLFGCMRGGALSNLKVEGSVRIATGQYVGGVAGWTDSVSFVNVENDVDVSGYHCIGGIAGYSKNSSFSGCKNSGNVTVAGYSYSQWGTAVYRSGSTAAGIAGQATGSTLIRDCYNAGTIATGERGSDNSGICAYPTSAVRMVNCVNVGSVGSGMPISTYNECTYINCIYLQADGMGADATGSVMKTADEMASAETAASLGEAWKAGATHPLLYWEPDADQPVITSHPVDAWAYAGAAAPEVSVTAQLPAEGAAAAGRLSYQWYETGADGAAEAIEGATSATWSPDPSAIAQHDVYCVVTNTYGDGDAASATSRTASCNVVSRIAAAAPSIAVQPQDVLVPRGGEGGVSVSAAVAGPGAGELSYQWYEAAGDAADPALDRKLPGATGATYSPDSSKPYHGMVYCVVTNTLEGVKSASTVSEIAELTVEADVMIYTAEEFMAFARSSTNYTGVAFKGTAFLMNDIDISSYCPEETMFPDIRIDNGGTFDGCGHRITGFYSAVQMDRRGGCMVSYLNGTFKNVVVEGTIVLDVNPGSSIYMGLVSNAASASILNVGSEVDYLFNTNAQAYYNGGVVASAGDTFLKGCYWKGTASFASIMPFGGIVGQTQSMNSIADCYSIGTYVVTSQYQSAGSIGGIIYKLSTESPIAVKGCYSVIEGSTNCVRGIYAYGSYASSVDSTGSYYAGEGLAAEQTSGAQKVDLADMKTSEFVDNLGSSYRVSAGSTPALRWEKHVAIDGDGYTVAAIPAQAYTGAAVEPEVTVTGPAGALSEGTDYEVSYSGNVSAGTAVANVVGKGGYKGTVTVPFTIEPASIAGGELSCDATAWYTGGPVDAGVKVELDGKVLVEGTDYAVTYFDSMGDASATSPTDTGSYKVYVTGKDNYAGDLGPVELSVARATVADAEAELANPANAYTGEGIAAKLTVTFEGKALSEGTDYTVSYADSDGAAVSGLPTEPGTYDVTVTGVGVYDGTLAAGSMAIAKTSIAGAEAVLANPANAYTGEAIAARLSVSIGDMLLVEGTDYTVSYADSDGAAVSGLPTEPGTYDVTVTGVGVYDGTLAAGSMAIAKTSIAGAEAVLANPANAYTGEGIAARLSVSIGDLLLVEGTDYEVRYAAADGSPVSGLPVEPGTYDVTVAGIGLYDGTLAAGTMAIAKTSIAGAEAVLANPANAYTGEGIAARLSVSIGDMLLVEGTDYEVRYAAADGSPVSGLPVEPGTYDVTVAGIGLYDGTLAAGSMTVSKTSIADAGVVVINPRTVFTGQPVEAEVAVVLGDKPLVEGTDYEVRYAAADGSPIESAPTEPGTYAVSVVGIGFYEGTLAAGQMEIAALADGFSRLAGETRLGTMEAIAEQGVSDGSASDVVLVSAYSYADALAASSLAGAYGCPLVTTATDALSPEAARQIERMASPDGVDVHIVGGTAAVSDAAAGQAAQLASVRSVERIAGSSRTETAIAVAKAGEGMWSGTAVLVKGWSFADALSASSYAYASASPLFMTAGGEVDADTAAAIDAGGFENVLVLGGAGGDDGISDAAAESLGLTWTRLAGDSRIGTSEAVASWATGGMPEAAVQPEVELTFDGMAIAYAWNYPDALASATLIGPSRSVLLLADGSEEGLAAINRTVSKHANGISEGWILGGTGVLPQEVEDVVAAALKGM